VLGQTFSNLKKLIRHSVTLEMTWKSHFNFQDNDFTESHEMEKLSKDKDKEQSVQFQRKVQ